MADSAPATSFQSGRAQLRDTTKWIINGGAALVALVIGSAGFSGLGAMPLDSWRLWLCVAAIAVSVWLCRYPFARGIDVLKSELMSMRAFAGAGEGELHTAFTRAQIFLEGQLPASAPTLTAFHDYYEANRAIVLGLAKGDPKAAGQEMVKFKDLQAYCSQLCTNELIQIRFAALMKTLLFPGSLILACLVTFAWAANPAKDSDKPLASPVEVTLIPTHEAAMALAALKLPAACFAPSARVALLSETRGGLAQGVIMTPAHASVECAPARVTVVNGRIAATGMAS
jgi:hypothetical protein